VNHGRRDRTTQRCQLVRGRWGWKVLEAPGVEPVFPEKRQAINYAQGRACFRSGQIRILDSTDKLERTIAFSESDRQL